MRRLTLLFGALALALPQTGFAKGIFHPEEEFDQHPWLPIHLGPLDLSVTKAVAYLWLGALLTMLLGIVLMRVKFRGKDDVGRRQALGETIYEVAQVQVAEQGLPTRGIKQWFPYVATLMLFIWVVNIIGFIPLPLSDQKFHLFGLTLPTFAIYAATSSLSVTFALALMTFTFTHVEGVRYNGAWPYIKSWMPSGLPKLSWKTFPLLGLIAFLEVLGQFMRLISLSVRLFANMLAGHMLILTFIGLIFVLESIYLVPFSLLFGTVFYLFEVVIVVSIQAFIFAALSAIYIGSAIEPGQH